MATKEGRPGLQTGAAPKSPITPDELGTSLSQTGDIARLLARPRVWELVLAMAVFVLALVVVDR